MAQRQQQWGPDNSSNDWLSTLIHGFDQTERLGDERCDDRLLCEVRARLAQPAAPHERKPHFTGC